MRNQTITLDDQNRKLLELLDLYKLQRNSHELDRIIRQLKNVTPHCRSYKTCISRMLQLFRYQRIDAIDQKLCEYLMTIDWFAKSFEAHKILLRNYLQTLSLVTYQPNSFIVTKGQPAESFYIIFDGRAGLIEEEHKPFSFAQAVGRHPSNKSTSRFKRLASIPAWQLKNELKSGQSFGELGIIYNRKRMASIVALSRCTLLCLPGEVFLEIRSLNNLQMHERRYKFVVDRFTPSIRDKSYVKQQEILHEFQPVTFAYGEEVFNSIKSVHYVMIEQGTATSYALKHWSLGRPQKLNTYGHGSFIGLEILLNRVNIRSNSQKQEAGQPDKLSNSVNFDQPMVGLYQVRATSSQTRGYRIKQPFLQKLAANNSQIMECLMRRTQMTRKLVSIKSGWVYKDKLLGRSQSTEKEKEVCQVSRKYQKLTLKISRRINSLISQKNKLKL